MTTSHYADQGTAQPRPVPASNEGSSRLLQLERLLLVCGILSSLLYISMDVVAALLLYPGYDYTSQQVSELSAIGAPSRPFWVAVSPAYVALMAAFGAGVALLPRARWYLRAAGLLIVAFALAGLFWPPMHMRGSAMLEDDMMHIVFAGIAVALMLGFMLAGAMALDRRFRIYSGVTIFAMLVAGYVVSLQTPQIAAGLPTPWMGLVERVSVYGPMIWLIVFAMALLRGTAPSAQRAG